MINTCSCHTAPTTHTPLSADETVALSGVFKALGHPVRLAIVSLLLDGERCVCELQQGSGRDMSTISSHLNILKNNGVVSCEQRGKNVYYSLRCACLSSVINCLRDTLKSDRK